MPAERRKLSKETVNYRTATTERRCGTCAMFNQDDNSCDLVKGYIKTHDVCDRWVKK